MSRFECVKCGASLREGPLHRINPKGEKGIWACHGCVPPDDETKRITAALTEPVDEGVMRQITKRAIH